MTNPKSAQQIAEEKVKQLHQYDDPRLKPMWHPTPESVKQAIIEAISEAFEELRTIDDTVVRRLTIRLGELVNTDEKTRYTLVRHELDNLVSYLKSNQSKFLGKDK